MTAVGVVGQVRHLASFTTGSALGLLVDLSGFWVLVHSQVAPGVANAVSSACSIAVVYLFVTRRTYRARVRIGTFLLFAGWYAVNIATVSVLITHLTTTVMDRPLLWKTALVPLSFAANYGFTLVLHRPLLRRRVVRIGLAGGIAALLAATAVQPTRWLPVGAAAPAVPGPRPGLADLLAGWTVLSRPLVIGGLGSSVGAGATLAHPERDAPVAAFASALLAHEGGLGPGGARVVNGSVNGSTIHDGIARDWPVLARSRPDVVVLAYGMNDGAPAQFDTGETYAGSMHDLTELVAAVRASGAVPVLLTSPSPHTVRFNWSPPAGPLTPQQAPVDTANPVRQVAVRVDGTVRSVPESSRHAAVDAGMREVARTLGVDTVDVEPYWLQAVATHGQDALFNPTEFVHPNLLGHRLGYERAIAGFLRRGGADVSLPLRATG